MVMAVWLFLLLSIIIKPQHCSYLFTAPSDRWWCMARLTYCDLLIYGRQCLGRGGFSRNKHFSFVTNSILMSLKKYSSSKLQKWHMIQKRNTISTYIFGKNHHLNWVIRIIALYLDHIHIKDHSFLRNTITKSIL